MRRKAKSFPQCNKAATKNCWTAEGASSSMRCLGQQATPHASALGYTMIAMVSHSAPLELRKGPAVRGWPLMAPHGQCPLGNGSRIGTWTPTQLRPTSATQLHLPTRSSPGVHGP